MKRALAIAFLIATVAVANAALPVAGRSGAVFEIQAGPQLLVQFSHAEQALELLAERGWNVRDLRVRLAQDPYDATLAPVDVLLPSSLPLEDQFFVLVQGVVRKNLGESQLAAELSDLVAAHMAPPSSRLRQRWEAGFQAALWAGDIERTALLELLWRNFKEDGVRAAKSLDDVWRMVESKSNLEGVASALWDVTLAALLAPQKLGWSVGPWAGASAPALAGDAAFRFVVPQVKFVALLPEGDGVAVLPGRLVRSAARLVLFYEDGRFDTLELEPGQEGKASFWGVKAVLLGVLSLPGEAQASFAVRELRDYPVRLGAVDLVAEGDSWQLSWEVESQEEVDAYVVEVWAVAEDGGKIVDRQLIPTAGVGPALLAWSAEARPQPSQLRVYALTQQGVLARLFTTPVLDFSGEKQAPYTPEQ
ncbi:hypothetical protein EG19_01835 [Thermoanaerobaculum aquaticum]|uniref:Uncharacterized protein n=1 Tax=Thermoanaerobaculum aquaticum TaxID=1312852 RepID=A0A062XT23_9BACT|nr:hypothetical protein [Thermoanaerobaculum aquaticum]KDA53963.1 hypothetical protein EG19_01835 [Thermoanaerobaculum aquaticum]